jgi:hypothetical protein
MVRLAPLVLVLATCSPTAEPVPRAPTALFFITADCPIANTYAPEIKRIIDEYGPRGLEFAMIYTDTTLDPEAMHRHAAEFGYPVPVMLDTGHSLSRRHGVTVTPEVVVLGSDGSRAYRGRIDDRYLAPGRYRLKPTTHELRDALDAILAGRPVRVAETSAAGCPLTE